MKKTILALALLGGGLLACATPALAADTSDLQQGVSAVVSTAQQAYTQFVDASNGTSGKSQFPTPDPRFVEGPAGGLLDGPLN